MDTGENRKDTREPNQQPTTEQQQQSSGDTSPAGSSPTKRTRRRTNKGDSAGSEGVQNQGIPKQIPVGEPVNIEVISAAAPAKKRSSSKKNPELDELTDNIKILVAGIFDGLSGAAGDHWRLRQDETEKLAVPLAKIIDRLGGLETTNAAADYIALFVAVGVILIPRVIISRKYKVVKQIERKVETNIQPINKQPAAPEAGDNGASSFINGTFPIPSLV